MIPFEYRKAESLDAACTALRGAEHGVFYGGGTNLCDYMKLDVVSPTLLVDVKRLPLHDIEETQDGIRIGANVTNSRLATDKRIREMYPVLSEAILSGASPQIRNMATTAGNVLQRTRCPYFRDVHSCCNKREPGSGCDAITGEHAKHAVLGVSNACIATHPSDMCVALAMLDTTVHTRKVDGSSRAVAFTDFHVLPGQTPDRGTVLEHGELITHVTIAQLPYGRVSRYVKVRDRASYEFALASAAVALDIEGGNIREARIALGGVATKPWRSPEAEAALAGRPAGEPWFTQAAEAALAAAEPRQQNAWKVTLAKRTLVVALKEAALRQSSAEEVR